MACPAIDKICVERTSLRGLVIVRLVVSVLTFANISVANDFRAGIVRRCDSHTTVLERMTVDVGKVEEYLLPSEERVHSICETPFWSLSREALIGRFWSRTQQIVTM